MYHLDFCVPFKLFWRMLHTVEHVPLRVLAYPQRLSPCWGRGGLRSRQRSGPTLRRARAVESATRASRRTWNAVEFALGRERRRDCTRARTPSRLRSGALSWPLGNLGRRRDCPRAPLCRRRDRPRAPCGRACGHASCVGAPGCFLWSTQKICAVRTCLAVGVELDIKRQKNGLSWNHTHH